MYPVKYNDLRSFCNAYKIDFATCIQVLENPVYESFSIPKKRGGKRTIESPNESLKQIQSCIARYLTTLYHAPEQVHGFVQKQKGSIAKDNLSNAQMHLQNRYLLNLDIKDFFHAISARKVLAALQLEPFGFTKEFAAQLALLCAYQGRLPMGAPSSPIVSNIVCRTLDFRLTQLLRQSFADAIVYTRYADDLSFSSIDAFPLFFDQLVIDALWKEGFEVNPKKYRMAGPKQAKYVTGIKVNKKLNVDRRYYRLLRAILHDAETNGLSKALQNYARHHQSNKAITEKQFLRILLGKIKYMERVKGKENFAIEKLHQRLKALSVA